MTQSNRAGAKGGAAATRTPRAPRCRTALQRALLFPALDLLIRPDRIVAAEAALIGGPVIVVANHTSDLDCPLVLRALPAAVRSHLAVAAAADRFHAGRLRGALFELAFGTVPFDRAPRGDGVAVCAAMLAQGTSLLLFPEGTRSRDGSMRGFHSCAARLALAAGVAVVPTGISGAFETLPPGSVVPHRHPVEVRVGVPITPRTGEHPRELTRRIEAAVRELATGVSSTCPAARAA